jgi:hypothetical protein
VPAKITGGQKHQAGLIPMGLSETHEENEKNISRSRRRRTASPADGARSSAQNTAGGSSDSAARRIFAKLEDQRIFDSPHYLRE